MTKRLLEVDEVKSLLVEELRFLDRVCRENQLRYYIFYGSLIGAMRHGGFIPWDDDVDVCMPRRDFMRLLELIRASDRYRIISIYNNADFTAPLAKLVDNRTLLVQHYGLKEKVQLGAYVDIFILDGLGDTEKAAFGRYAKSVRLRKCWAATNHGWRYDDSIARDILRYIYYLPQHIKGYRYYLDKIDKHASELSFDECEFVGNLIYPVYVEIYRRSDFDPIDVEFENITLIAPSGYNRLLTGIYGDWRAFPPVEKRVSHHDYDCYWID